MESHICAYYNEWEGKCKQYDRASDWCCDPFSVKGCQKSLQWVIENKIIDPVPVHSYYYPSDCTEFIKKERNEVFRHLGIGANDMIIVHFLPDSKMEMLNVPIDAIFTVHCNELRYRFKDSDLSGYHPVQICIVRNYIPYWPNEKGTLFLAVAKKTEMEKYFQHCETERR